MSGARLSPSLDLEASLWAAGYRYVAGVDEAGRGAWAGPVVAAAVVLPPDDPDLLLRLDGVCDSKQLDERSREALLQAIQQHCLTRGVGIVSPQQVDALGIVAATRLAMALAVQELVPSADYLLLDHLRLPAVPLPQHSLPKGDALVLSIAAASIVAKVTRDRIMVRAAAQVPGYGFAEHKGYGTRAHQAALGQLGPSSIHRMSFAPLREMKR